MKTIFHHEGSQTTFAANGTTRRHLLTGMSGPVLIALAATLPAATYSRAAMNTVPPSVHALDEAAMSLFDAAETGKWSAAKQALERARVAASTAAGIESAYVEAGGELRHYFEARNNLNADLIEARTALSVKDRRWLVSSADRIAQRAGELAQPFARGSNTNADRIDTLLFLARRIRRARVWQDNMGLRATRDDFRRLWKVTRTELTGIPADKLRALDDALARLSEPGNGASENALYHAVRALIP